MTTVLWDEVEPHGLLIEPLERFEQTLATLRILRAATTWGELRQAELPGWAQQVIDAHVRHLEDEGAPPQDRAAFDYGDIAEQVTDAVPLPTDATHTAAWLGPELLTTHAKVTGASPGGHDDQYRVHNREAFLAALRYAGFTPVHRPGFYTELLRSC